MIKEKQQLVKLILVILMKMVSTLLILMFKKLVQVQILKILIQITQIMVH